MIIWYFAIVGWLAVIVLALARHFEVETRRTWQADYRRLYNAVTQHYNNAGRGFMLLSDHKTLWETIGKNDLSLWLRPPSLEDYLVACVREFESVKDWQLRSWGEDKRFVDFATTAYDEDRHDEKGLSTLLAMNPCTPEMFYSQLLQLVRSQRITGNQRQLIVSVLYNAIMAAKQPGTAESKASTINPRFFNGLVILASPRYAWLTPLDLYNIAKLWGDGFFEDHAALLDNLGSEWMEQLVTRQAPPDTIREIKPCQSSNASGPRSSAT